ncbi:HotDog domain-containing protein [Sporodiniella umbellata]|nr:HotDog domain-containing protein [Sporodiniella umbellata]
MLLTRALYSPDLTQKVLKSFMGAGGYDAHILPKLKLTGTQNGAISAEFEVEKHHLNRLGSVHGGLLATVVDIGGSLALASKGLYATGVSTDINISYISGAKEGETISVKARVDKLGKTLAFTTVELYSKDKLLALGRHNKFMAKAYQHPENELKI